MKRKITWVEDSASVAKLSAGFSLFFFTYPGTIIALQMKKCRIARHNLTNICSQTLLSFCGVFAGGGIVSLLDYSYEETWIKTGTIEKHLRLLEENGRIRKEDTDSKGRWIIL